MLVEYYTEMDSAEQVAVMTLTADNATIVSVWANAVIVEEIDPFDSTLTFPGLNVQCGDTVKRASLGDRVLKHGDGTYDVMSPMELMSRYARSEG